MFNIRRTGNTIAEVIASARDVPTRIIPYAAATALTRTAKTAQAEVGTAMRTTFDRPTQYTLNATYTVVATKDKLSARVAVKDTAGTGVIPEHYLLPEVQGGGRREKGLERALRGAGFMRSGERAMPGQGVALDAYGNVSAGTVRNILGQLSTGRQSRIFVGTVGRKQTRGVWQRDGRKVKPLFVFTTRLPQYSPILDFTAIADRTARRDFGPEFAKAAAALQARGAA